jgi:hypothetical protein
LRCTCAVSRQPRRWYNLSGGAEAALFAALAVGCTKAPPAPADLSKTPWLDPTVQMEGLESSNARIRGASVLNLGNLGAAAADAIPQLEKLANDDPEPKIRAHALEALEKIRSSME